MIDILIVDDHASFCKTMTIAINQEKGLRVVQAVNSAEDAIEVLNTVVVEVVILDINLGKSQMNGIEAARKITRIYPMVAVILQSWDLQIKYIEEVIQSGASCYIEKHTISGLIRSIKEVHMGKMFFHFCSAPSKDEEETSLNDRKISHSSKEMQILGLIGQGLDETQIAKKTLCLYATYRIHKRNLMAKLRAINDEDLLLKAFQERLILV